MKKLRFQWSTFSAENIIIILRYVFDLIKYKLWSKWGQVWVRYHFLPLCLTCNKIFVNQMRHLPVILYLYLYTCACDVRETRHLTWNLVPCTFPIHTCPGLGGVRSTIIPSLQMLSSGRTWVHISCFISVYTVCIQTMYRSPWTSSPGSNLMLMNSLAETSCTACVSVYVSLCSYYQIFDWYDLQIIKSFSLFFLSSKLSYQKSFLKNTCIYKKRVNIPPKISKNPPYL